MKRSIADIEELVGTCDSPIDLTDEEEEKKGKHLDLVSFCPFAHFGLSDFLFVPASGSSPLFRRPSPPKPAPKPMVIDVSRRNDVPANRAQLQKFLFDLENGEAQYQNQYLGRNVLLEKANPKSICTVSLAPKNVLCLSLWSKDYTLFLEAYNSERWGELLHKFTYHFNFTICSSTAHSRIEPGMESTLEERLDQLDQLAAIARTQSPNLDYSIGIRCDPIVVYKDLRTGEVSVLLDLVIFTRNKN